MRVANAGARDAARRGRRVKHATRRNVQALLLRQLALRRRLVHRGVVELVEAVLRDVKELERGIVLRRRLDEVLVLLLALLRLLRDLGHELRDRLLVLADARLEALDPTLRVLLRVLGGVELPVAPRLLRLIIRLLLVERHDHVIDHLDHLLEALLLPAEREDQEVQIQAPLALLQLRNRIRTHIASARRHLQQRRRSECFLKEVQRIVVVEHLDRLRDRNQLLRARRLASLVLFALRRTALLQLHQEPLVSAEAVLRVLQIVLQRHNLHRGLARTLRLRLDRVRRSLDLLLLRRHERLELGDRGVLRLRRLVELLLHVLLELVQNARDLARHRRVLRVRRQEVRQHTAAVAVHVARDHEVAKLLRLAGLQERAAHALAQSRNRLLARADVRLQLRRLGRELRRLLLALLRRRINRLLRRLARSLVVLQLLVELHLQALRLGNVGLNLRNPRTKLRRPRRQRAVVRLAVARKLVVQVVVTLLLRRHLCLHLLQQIHNAANRVLLELRVLADQSCLYSSQHKHRQHCCS